MGAGADQIDLATRARVTEGQLQIMQARHRRHHAHAQAIARRVPTGFSPVQPTKHRFALALGNARAGVGDTNSDRALLRDDRQADAAMVGAKLDGVVQQVAEGIEQAVGQARLDILHGVTADFPELQLGVLSAAVGHLAIELGVDFGTFARTDKARAQGMVCRCITTTTNWWMLVTSN